MQVTKCRQHPNSDERIDGINVGAIKKVDEGVGIYNKVANPEKECVVYFICRCFSLRDFTWSDDCVRRNEISDEIKSYAEILTSPFSG